jgi:hypothetical protein
MLLVVLLALVVAPGALAAKRIRFAVTLHASISSSWQHELRYSTGGCDVTQSSIGEQRFEVRSARPTRVTLVARRGRLRTLAGTLRHLTVAAGGGSATTLTTCGQFTTWDCGPAPPEVKDASARFARSAQAPGLVGLSWLHTSALETWRSCLPTALADPGYPLLADTLGRLDEPSLLRRRAVSVSGDREAITHLVSPTGDERGELDRRLSWTLTFRRLGRR